MHSSGDRFSIITCLLLSCNGQETWMTTAMTSAFQKIKMSFRILFTPDCVILDQIQMNKVQ